LVLYINMRQQNKKFLNLYLLWSFVLILVILLGYFDNYYYFVCLVPFFIFSLNLKVPIKTIASTFIVLIIIFANCLLLQQYLLFSQFSKWIDQLLHFSFRNELTNFISKNYEQMIASFMKLVLLNIKDNFSWKIYNQLIDMSIVHLIVISGFHLSVLIFFINILIKNKWINQIITIFIVIILTYFLNFSSSVLRVLLTIIVNIILSNFKFKFSKYDVVSIAGIFTIIFEPYCVKNIGFILSYLCTIGTIYIYGLELNNKLIEKILISLNCNLIALPFLILLNNQISFWSILNSLLFGYVFCFIFIYLLLTFWIVWIKIIHYYLITTILYLTNAYWLINLPIDFIKFNTLWNSTYYSIYFFTIICLNKLRVKSC
jgi:ComEC/Rec2-related protein